MFIQQACCWSFNPKRARGAESTPLDIFCYISASCYFFTLKLHDVFLFKPCAQFKIIFKKIGPRVMTGRCIIVRWVQRKTDQKLIFNENYTQIMFFVFRIHFHYVLSYLFGLFWFKHMCKHTLTHIIAKKCNFAWKNSKKIAKKPWFWRFLVIFVFFTWRHCGVIQGMFVLFLVPVDSGGHSYPLVPHTWLSSIGFRDLRGWNLPPPPPPPPAVRWVQKALLGLNISNELQLPAMWPKWLWMASTLHPYVHKYLARLHTSLVTHVEN